MKTTAVIVSTDQFELTQDLVEHLNRFPLELVLVNNGSEESDYTNTDWGFPVLHLKHPRPLQEAFRAGAVLATQELLICLEPCDRLLEHRLIHQLDQIQKDSLHWVQVYQGQGDYNPRQIYSSESHQLSGLMVRRSVVILNQLDYLTGSSSRTPCVYRNLDQVSSIQTLSIQASKVSIVILSQNNFAGIQRLLKSLPEAELILINNGSTDKVYTNHTFEVDRMVNLDQPRDWIDLVRIGAELASGDYLALTDDRSEWLPGKLKLQLEQMSEHKSRICSTEVKLASGQLYNRELHWDYLRQVLGLEDKFPEYWDLNLISKHNLCIWFSVVVETSILKAGLVSSSDQWELWKWILSQSGASYLPEALSIYH